MDSLQIRGDFMTLPMFQDIQPPEGLALEAQRIIRILIDHGDPIIIQQLFNDIFNLLVEYNIEYYLIYVMDNILTLPWSYQFEQSEVYILDGFTEVV